MARQPPERDCLTSGRSRLNDDPRAGQRAASATKPDGSVKANLAHISESFDGAVASSGNSGAAIEVSTPLRTVQPFPQTSEREYNFYMPEIPYEQQDRDHAQYMEERKGLIDAARESARTFDQAVLAFGSAVFGASIAFLKDVAPNPQVYSLKWLGIAWGLFSFGLLSVMLSFLFSHKACIFDIASGMEELKCRDYQRPKNRFSPVTDWCNYVGICLLFLGLLSWMTFALENLSAHLKP